MTRSVFKKLSFFLVAIILSGTLWLSTTYATLAPLTTPPTGGYDAGSNSILDPGCTPTDTDCFVKTGLRIGEPVINGTAKQMLYTDNSGNLFSDSLFTRDSTTHVTDIQRNFTSGLAVITTGFTSEDNFSGSGISGTALSQSDGTTGDVARIGVFDISPFGGPTTAAGIFANDVTGTNSSNLIVTSTGGSWTLGNTVGDTTGFVLSPNSFQIASAFSGQQQVGIQSDGTHIGWSKGSTQFFLPTTTPTSGQVPYVSGISGSDITLGWTTAGTSPITIVNTSNLFSTGLLNTGAGVTTVSGSNFFGDNAGRLATSASNSNFLGSSSGKNATNASNANFFGIQSGEGATNSDGSNFFGYQAGLNASSAPSSNFLGTSAGSGATNASSANFIGYQAGMGAISANNANFIGSGAGSGATGAVFANFIGSAAGYGATTATYANFFGQDAGRSATSASGSNFFGPQTGQGATNASESNFLGGNAGQNAINANDSNFFGRYAGQGATNANNANFLGFQAGLNALNAANSIFIGKNSGNGDTVNNTLSGYSILLGPNTSTGSFSNSIALGDSAINTATNQFMIGSTTSPVNTLVLTGAGGNTCVLDVTVASPSCSSDETLKMNIVDLSTTTLDNLLKVKTVTYNWINYPNKTRQIGFLAQDLEQYFPEVVSTAPNGYKTVSYGGVTPILVEALREMNLKISDFSATNTNPTGLVNIIRNWLGDVTNGITRIFAKTVHVTNGIEMVDRATGQVYCTYIENGEVKKDLGECTDVVPNTTPTIIQPTVSDPVVIPTTAPDPTPASTPTPDPAVTSDPTPAPTPAPDSTPISDPAPAPVVDSGTTTPTQ